MAIKFLNSVAVDTNVLYVDAATNRVGVGTSNPETDLHVNGHTLLTNNKELRWLDSTGAQKSILKLSPSNLLSLTAPDRIRATTDGTARVDIFSGNNTKYVMSSVHSFADNNSDVALRIASSGKVGIGTVNPTARLQVVGSSGAALKTTGDISLTTYNSDTKIDMGDEYLQLLSPDGEVQIGDPEFDNNGTSIIVDDTNTKVVISTGNVGIGTTSPDEKLDVEGYFTVGDGTEKVVLGYDYVAGESGIHKYNTDELIAAITSTGNYVYGNEISDPYLFISGSNGKVGIGTTSPKAKLDVNGGVRIGNDTDAASADKVGTLRYHVSDGYAKLDICMVASGAGGYAWFNVLRVSMSI